MLQSEVGARASTLNKLWALPPKESVSEWVDKHAYTEDGKMYVATAEYQRGIMDALSNSAVEEVVMMTSAQVGKTAILLNTIGRYVHRDPCPILWVLPSITMAKQVSKARIAPMFDITPALTGLLAEKRVRDGQNALDFKKFRGGFLILAGANSPVSLSSWPIRVLLGDEIDRWGKLIKGEGDILMLARKRTTKYASNKKICLVSTPTEEESSRIYPAYQETNQQKYHVPCPHCNAFQVLEFKNLQFEYDKEAIKGLVDVNNKDEEEFDWQRKAIAEHIHAYFVCTHCGAAIEHEYKSDMVRDGRWVAKFPRIRKRQGFHIWQAYSPFVTWSETAAEFLYAKGYPDRMRVFTNTVLGELWIEKGGRIDDMPLVSRCEEYPEKLPEKIELLTCGVDVQGDRLEAEIIGWAADGENWSLRYDVFRGNTQLEETYTQLNALWDYEWVRADGAILRLDAMAIDVGYDPTAKSNKAGVETGVVYRYVRSMSKAYRVFAVKGSSSHVDGVVKRTRAGSSRQALWICDGQQIKDIVLGRLSITTPGQGYSHFPIDRDREYFRMLTAEEKKMKSGVRVWVKIRERNEAVDTRQYAYAALRILNPSWGAIKRATKKAAKQTKKKKLRFKKDE